MYCDVVQLADELRLARERKTSDSLSDGVPQTELSLEHLSLNDLIQLRQQRQTHLERIDKVGVDPHYFVSHKLFISMT